MLSRVYSGEFKQVYNPRVDFSNPITKQIAFATICSDRGRASLQDLVTNTIGSFSGSTKPSWEQVGVSSPGGATTVASIDFGTMASTQDFGKTADGSVPYSFLFRMKLGTANTSIARRNDNNTVSAGWEIAFNTGALYLIHESSTSNMSAATSNSLINNGAWYTCAVCSDGTQTALNQQLYINGEGPLTLASHVDGVGTPASDSAQSFQLLRGSAAKNNSCFNGSMAFFYAWRRKLNISEVKQLSKNPYLIFQPDVFALTMPMVVAKGGNAAGKSGGGSKRGGGGANNQIVPGGTVYFNIGNAGDNVQSI